MSRRAHVRDISLRIESVVIRVRERSFHHARRRPFMKPSRPSGLRAIVPSVLGAGLALGLGLAGGTAEAAQAQTGTIRVEVVEAGSAGRGRDRLAGGRSAATDASGVATLALPPGPVSVVATKDGYEPATARVDVVAGSSAASAWCLTPKPAAQEQPTVVASTRIAPAHRRTGRSRRGARPRPDRREHADDAGQHRRCCSTSMRGVRAQNHVAGAGPRRWCASGACAASTRGCSPTACPLLRSSRRARAGADPGDGPRPGGSPHGGRLARSSARTRWPAWSTCCRAGPDTEPNREILFSQSASGGTDGALWLSTPADGNVEQHDVPRRARIGRTNATWTTTAGRTFPVTRVGSCARACSGTTSEGKSASGTAGVTFEKREGGSAFAHQ